MGITRSAMLIFLSLLAVASLSCHEGGETSTPSQGQQYAASPEIAENSGRHLSGEFAVRSVEDVYTAKDFTNPVDVIFKFTEDGTFRRERLSKGVVTSWDEGSYIIDTHDNLALYIESAGGVAFASARLEVYTIKEQGVEGLKLSRGEALTLLLQKR